MVWKIKPSHTGLGYPAEFVLTHEEREFRALQISTESVEMKFAFIAGIFVWILCGWLNRVKLEEYFNWSIPHRPT